MKFTLKVVCAALALCGGSSFAAAAPHVDVDASVGYQPPREEVSVVVEIHRRNSKPIVVDAGFFFDRHGRNDDDWEGSVYAGRPGKEIGLDFYTEETPDDEGPTGGLVTDTTVELVNKACDETGLC